MAAQHAMSVAKGYVNHAVRSDREKPRLDRDGRDVTMERLRAASGEMDAGPTGGRGL
jgi:hypothetical protein